MIGKDLGEKIPNDDNIGDWGRMAINREKARGIPARRRSTLFDSRRKKLTSSLSKVADSGRKESEQYFKSPKQFLFFYSSIIRFVIGPAACHRDTPPGTEPPTPFPSHSAGESCAL